MRMPLAKQKRIRDEKVNGQIFDMSPAPSYQHSAVTNNINCIIKAGLKGSMSMVFM